MRTGQVALDNKKLNLSKIFGILVIGLFIGIILMIVLVIRAALSGPSAPTSTYDYNLNQYQSLLESNPNDIGARIGVAQTYLMAKKYGEAKTELLEVVKFEKKAGVDPLKLSIVHYLLGQIYNVEGNSGEAIVEMKKAVKFDVNNDTAYFQLGMLQVSRKMYRDAAASFKKVVSLTPIAADAHFQLGLVYAKLGNKSEALRELKTSLQYVPGDKEVIAAISSLTKGK